MTVEPDAAEAAIAAYFAAMRTGPAAETDLLALFTDDATYSEPFSGLGPARGSEAIAERFRAGWENPAPDMELDVLSVRVEGTRGESRWECRSPVFPSPQRGRDEYEFVDGRIHHLTVTLDSDIAAGEGTQ